MGKARLAETAVILWHPCAGCGEWWPFPLGATPSGDGWRCARCLGAATDRALRQVRSATRYQVRHGAQTKPALEPAPDGRWVDADEVALALADLEPVRP